MQNKVIYQMLSELDRQGIPRVIACFDIDKTFRMHGEELANESKVLTAALYAAHIPHIAITGVHFTPDKTTERPHVGSILDRTRSGNLPYFPVVMSNVGTDMYFLTHENGKKTYVKDTEYESQLLAKGFDRRHIVEKFERVAAEINSSAEWRTVQLVFQEPVKEEQFLKNGESLYPFKVSGYFFAPDRETIEFVHRTFRDYFPTLHVLVCEEINYNRAHPLEPMQKYCLDILPITKVEAAYHVRNMLKAPIMIRAGDSGNDIELLLEDKPITFEAADPLLDISLLVGGAEENIRYDFDSVVRRETIPLGSTLAQDGFSAKKIDHNRMKIYYKEAGKRKGPQSVIYALSTLGNVLLKSGYPLTAEEKSALTTLTQNLTRSTADEEVVRQIYQ